VERVEDKTRVHASPNLQFIGGGNHTSSRRIGQEASLEQKIPDLHHPQQGPNEF
jgi:hypothetical protein